MTYKKDYQGKRSSRTDPSKFRVHIGRVFKVPKDVAENEEVMLVGVNVPSMAIPGELLVCENNHSQGFYVTVEELISWNPEIRKWL